MFCKSSIVFCNKAFMGVMFVKLTLSQHNAQNGLLVCFVLNGLKF